MIKLALLLILSVNLVGFAKAGPTTKTDPFDRLFNGPRIGLEATLEALKEMDQQFVNKEKPVYEEGFDDIIRLCIDAASVRLDKCNNDKAFDMQNLAAMRWGSPSLEAYIEHYAELQFSLCRQSLLENSTKRFETLSEENRRVLYRLVDDVADEGIKAGNNAYELEYYQYVPDLELARGVLKFMKRRAFRSWDQVDDDDIEQIVGKLCNPFRDSTDAAYQYIGPVSARTDPQNWSPITVERVCRQILKQKPTLIDNIYRTSVRGPKYPIKK